jgi:hypothetical protein
MRRIPEAQQDLMQQMLQFIKRISHLIGSLPCPSQLALRTAPLPRMVH